MSNDRTEFVYLIQGDVSGIQDFIFGVKSKGASKALKARSVFIQAITDIYLYQIQKFIAEKKGKSRLFFNGGGNFLLYTDLDPTHYIAALRKRIATDFGTDSLYFSLSWVPVEYQNGHIYFSGTWRNLQEENQSNKLAPFSGEWQAFEPFPKPQVEEWGDFTTRLVRSEGYDIEPDNAPERVAPDALRLSGYRFALKAKPLSGGFSFAESLMNKLPVWKQETNQRYQEAIKAYREEQQRRGGTPEKRELNNVIAFEYLSVFAKARTGTDKLGVLKMDVDGLGNFFRSVKEETVAAQLSQRLTDFFNRELLTLLQGTFNTVQVITDEHGQPKTRKMPDDSTIQETETRKDSFFDNVYTVFSGGDDCFFIGGWDAVFALAAEVRSAFSRRFADTGLTISAGLVVVDPKFPVIRFAKIAGAALRSAKRGGDGKGNKINVFGENLYWDAFGEARNWATRMETLIKRHNEPRALIQRIKKAQTGYQRLVYAAENESVILAPKVWRLAWFLRSGSKKRPEAVENLVLEIMSYCENTLLDAAMGQKNANPAVFGVAARWAEFLTKK